MRRLLILAACALVSLGACHKPQPAADEGAAAKVFMAKVAAEPGVRALPDGLYVKVVRAGPASGRRPQARDEVKVHYEGKLIDGTVFDSSYQRGQPAAMPLDQLIPAWRQALQLMRPGDEWILYVPPAMGYGAEGAGRIPPNSALIFRIELIDFLPAPGSVAQG